MDDLNQTDKTLHSLAQLIALTGMQWLPLQTDDSQTNMAWNPVLHWLEGRAFDQAGQHLRLVIDTEAFTVQFVDGQNRVLGLFSPEGKTPADALMWWNDQMRSWEISAIRPLNYHLDHEPVAPDAVYQRPSALSEWNHWRTVANESLQTLNQWSDQQSEIRIWPHHFDTGVYYSLTDAQQHERAAIWAGYAIADSICSEPYFYLSGYNRTQPINFLNASTLSAGEWRTGADWQGALLSISGTPTHDRIDAFFRESYAWLHESINP
ncbi:hypothetical protein [Spirosoma aerolatum]|uniref:hypothetical protein n=1 Tax=Spirosoma aerolatum TaxID=1211326 RepID=UPI0009AC08CF|nr:hypothetical protein [Spirosoma aerolatum]